MCTSMSPDSRTTVAPVPAPVSRVDSRPRCRVPRTSCGDVLRAGELDECFGDVVADDLVVGAAQRFDEGTLPGQMGRARAGEPVRSADVHGEQVTPRHPGGDPGRSADQRVALRPAVQADGNPLPRFPKPDDVVLAAVALHLLVDLVGQPKQGELAQRGEIADPEVIGQSGVDLVCAVDVAVGHPAAQRLGGHVDKLDLVGAAHPGVRHGFPLHHPSDLGDDVVERLEMLDVQRGDHVDACVEQLIDVLPALLVARSRDVGMRQLVDERNLRTASQHRVDIQLGEHRPAVLRGAPRHDLQTGQGRGGLRPTVHLDETHDHVGAPVQPAVPLVEHRERLADPGRGPQIDPQSSSGHGWSPVPLNRRAWRTHDGMTGSRRRPPTGCREPEQPRLGGYERSVSRLAQPEPDHFRRCDPSRGSE